MTGIFLNRETNAIRKLKNQQNYTEKKCKKDEKSREKKSTHKMSNLCLFNQKRCEKYPNLAKLLNVKLMLIQSKSVKILKRKKLSGHTKIYAQTNSC